MRLGSVGADRGRPECTRPIYAELIVPSRDPRHHHQNARDHELMELRRYVVDQAILPKPPCQAEAITTRSCAKRVKWDDRQVAVFLTLRVTDVEFAVMLNG